MRNYIFVIEPSKIERLVGSRDLRLDVKLVLTQTYEWAVMSNKPVLTQAYEWAVVSNQSVLIQTHEWAVMSNDFS